MKKINIEVDEYVAKKLIELLEEKESTMLYNACRKYTDNAAANNEISTKNKDNLVAGIADSIEIRRLYEQIKNKLEKK